MKKLRRIRLAHTGLLLITWVLIHIIYYFFAGEVWANGIQTSLVCISVSHISMGEGLRIGYSEGVKEGKSYKKLSYWRSID